MMGNFERDKGNRIEREVINLHKQAGIFAERVPLSGATGYQNRGYDVDIYASGRSEPPFKAEVKGRASGAGFAMLERWLGSYDVLFLRRDRQEPLVVVPWQIWLTLVEQSGADRSIDTRHERRKKRDAATCERPEVKRGDGHEHPDEP